jgi:hypothetical protein
VIRRPEKKQMREILTAEYEFVIGILGNSLRAYWYPPRVLAARGEAAIRQYLEIKHNAVPGTYRFLERCRELNVRPELRALKEIDSTSDQTEITLPADAPEELKRRLHDISRTQDLDRSTADAYWQGDAWQQEDEF